VTDLNRDDIAQGARGCVRLAAAAKNSLAQLFTEPRHGRANRTQQLPRTQFRKRPRTAARTAAAARRRRLVPRRFHNLSSTYHNGTPADYTPIRSSTRCGRANHRHNRSAAEQQAGHPRLVRSPERQSIYNSYRWSQGPGRRGAQVSAAVDRARAQRELHVPDNPNWQRFCDERHLEDGFSIPSVRISDCGSLPLPGVTLSGALQSNRGARPAPRRRLTPVTLPNPLRSPWARPPGIRRTVLHPVPRAPRDGPSPTVTTLTGHWFPLFANVADRINQLDIKARGCSRSGE
jgi:hypothetical protein